MEKNMETIIGFRILVRYMEVSLNRRGIETPKYYSPCFRRPKRYLCLWEAHMPHTLRVLRGSGKP